MVMFNTGTTLKRFSTGKIGLEPRWHMGHGVRPKDLSDEMAVWLFDSESLTKRLRQASGGEFRVRLLRQQFERPLMCERRALGMPDRACALVRQVHLYCGNEVKVYARTIMPLTVLRGRSRGLARLGGRPLGEMLFRDKSMRRSPMEIAKVEPGDLFYRWGVPEDETPGGQIWGRRSVFRLAGQPLLVNEVFLPPVLKVVGFRIKHKV
jgi:chorismate--pyruvate lyase